MVPEAYGLEYACAGSFLVVPGIPGRKLLGFGFVAGAALLIAYSAKRGVELTLFISIATAWIATKRLRKLSRRTIMALACGLLVAVFAASIVEGVIVLPPNVPLLSHIAKRASGQQSSAAKNVTLRELLWGYALKTSWDEDPLFGVGAYHPIDVDYQGNDIATKGFFGVHDSYIGYTFYAGYLEGLLVVFVFLWGVVRLWRVRRRSIYAPAVLGCLVAAILTATTNVSFELTYLGGPSWLILGLAFGLSAKLLDQPDPDPAVVSTPGYEETTTSEMESRAYAGSQGHGRHLARGTPGTGSVTT
jgi:O-antigen ligase